MKWIWLLGLTIAAWEDIKSREVSGRLLWFLLIPGMMNVFLSEVPGHLAAASVGAAMLLLSYVTRGALGKGDGLFFLLSACYLEFGEVFLLFFLGLGISSAWSMSVVLRSFLTGRDKRSETIPFLACVWLPGVWLTCR